MHALQWLVVFSLCCGCVDEPAASPAAESYEPLESAPPETRHTFTWARSAGARLAIVEIARVEPLPEGFVSGEGEMAIRFPSGADVEAVVLAAEEPLDEVIRFRLVTGSSCGHSAADPEVPMCAELSFMPPPLEPGQVWQLGIGPYGAPNEGYWAMMAGRLLPADASPQAALSDARELVGP